MSKSEGRKNRQLAISMEAAEDYDGANVFTLAAIAEFLEVVAEELVRLNDNTEKRWKDGHRL